MSYKFKASDKVIVRNKNANVYWRFDFFSHYRNNSIHPYETIGGVWECCLPYEGNEHLIGSIKDPEEKDKPFEWGERLIYEHDIIGGVEAIFLFTDCNDENICRVVLKGHGLLSWVKKERLRRRRNVF